MEETIALGYLKIKTTSQIIQLIYNKKCCAFAEIASHINRASSTTSWNLKRLDEAVGNRKSQKKETLEFLLKNPKLIAKLTEKNKNNTIIDRSIDIYASVIDDL